MYRHNLLISYRNFKRYKKSFLINLVGLSTGLSCTLLIFLWVNDEQSVDKFYKNHSRIYQVMEHFEQDYGIRTVTSTAGPMANALDEEIPEVEATAVTAGAIENVSLSTEETNVRANGLYLNAEFFNIFSYEFLQLKSESVFPDRKSITISNDLASKLFGSPENALGRDVTLQQDQKYFISGVFKNLPSNASHKFDFGLPYELFEEKSPSVLRWQNSGNQVYALLKEGTDVDQVNDKIKDYIKIKTNGQITFRTPFLKLYSDKYLYGQYRNGKQSGGRIVYVRLFSIIAVFILGIACINFMNLSTSRATRRLKEVGVKKVMGAQRVQLISQYLTESILMVFISAVVAILIALILLPWFNQITGKVLEMQMDLTFALIFLAMVLTIGLVAGSYPAFYLSGFKPIAIIKGTLNSQWGVTWMRKGLVVFQFTVSLILIAAVIVITNQMDFIQEKDLGYERDNIISFPREGRLMESSSLETFLGEINNLPGVSSTSTISHHLAGHVWGVGGPLWEGKNIENQTEFELVPVNYGMLEMLNMEIVKGRSFSRDFGSELNSIIFNESAIELMGLKNPIGEPIKGWGPERQIIGVVKDFHFESLHENIKPLAFLLWTGRTNRIMAKLVPGKEKETIQNIEKLNLEHNPGFPLNYKFLDQVYSAQYTSEQMVSVLSKNFAVFAILISVLGLFALVSFTAEQRYKEIGVRKILGLSSLGLLKLLSQDFVKLILVSIVIGLPIVYLISKEWLDDFAYRIELETWFFLGAGILTLLIALFTIVIQTRRVTLVSPVDYLRNE